MKRKSRSRSSSEEVKEDEKFNFDVLEYEIDPNKRFVLSVNIVVTTGLIMIIKMQMSMLISIMLRGNAKKFPIWYYPLNITRLG